MKKLIASFLLIASLTFGAFADDGDLPTGNRSCPNPQQQCLTSGDPVEVKDTGNEDKSGESGDLLSDIQDWFNSLLG